MSAYSIPVSLLSQRFVQARQFLPSGVAAFDALKGGIPRGSITQIVGARSSGKSSFVLSALGEATRRNEVCAIADTYDRFDPVSAQRSGVDLEKLIWVRCNADPAVALKVTDLLIQGGGLGLVCLDLSDAPAAVINRLPISYWYRFRNAIENSPTILLVAAEYETARSCAAESVEFQARRVTWSGKEPARLLGGLEIEATAKKPHSRSFPLLLKVG